MLTDGDNPLDNQAQGAAPEPTVSLQDEPVVHEAPFKWYHKASAIAFTIICFELGVFLLVFPWMDKWETNYFAGLNNTWRGVWHNPFFRGAISGLGLINIFISFVEIVRLRRFSVQ